MKTNAILLFNTILIFFLFFTALMILPIRIDSSEISGVDKLLKVDKIVINDYNSRYYNYHNSFNELKLTNYSKEKKIVTSLIIELLTQKLNIVTVTNIMNSSWPMYCHDTHHTGRSPYSTADNPLGVIKWSFGTNNCSLYGSPAIDKNGIVYIGSGDLFALYPNGTKMWQCILNGECESCPAIDENGIIYVGTAFGDPNYLYAIYPDGTTKWRYWIGGRIDIKSSPVIGCDGIIYFTCGGDYPPVGSINALYPNGTLKWSYETNHVVLSSPAIGDDGTIYCGCHDTYFYALNPNNGTLKWRFKTDDWIRTSPCIGDDGTIYCASWDDYLYALYPNGTMKWRTYVEAGTSPIIGWDGTIYTGLTQLHAVNPVDGSIKWNFTTGGYILGSTPCTSLDGTIYFGTITDVIDGFIFALNMNGTELWRSHIGKCESAPAIGEDGTIYIGGMDSNSNGYLYAFGKGPLKIEANGPYKGTINQPVQLTGTIFGGMPPYTCHWDFGDGNSSEEQNPTHTYTTVGVYTTIFTVTDAEGNYSNDTAQVTVTAPKPSVTITKPINGIYFKDRKILPFTKIFIIGKITILVEANQEPFGIDRVEFFIDDTFKATDTTSPYSWIWETPAFFTHTIKIIAYDMAGNSASNEISIKKFF